MLNDTTKILNEIATKVRIGMAEKQFDAKGFAEKCGLTRQYVSQIKEATASGLTVDSLVKTANGLNKKLEINFIEIEG